MTGETLLELDEITAGYGTTAVLDGMSLRIARGERLAILGRNGAGKSTLLATVMGLTQRFDGRIRLRGNDITRAPTHRRAALGIGLVPQSRELFTTLTVEENLKAIRYSGGRLEDAYDMFPRLRERARDTADALSDGEAQMLALARTLMMRPELLLLDEPMEGQAPTICEILMHQVARLAAESQLTVVLVDSHVDIALAFAQRVILLDNGRIVYDAPAAALKARPDLIDRHIGSLNTQ